MGTSVASCYAVPLTKPMSLMLGAWAICPYWVERGNYDYLFGDVNSHSGGNGHRDFPHYGGDHPVLGRPQGIQEQY